MMRKTTRVAGALALVGLAALAGGCDEDTAATTGTTELKCDGTKLVVGGEQICLVGVDEPPGDIKPPQEAVFITETGAKPRAWYETVEPKPSSESGSCDSETTAWAHQVWSVIVCAPGEELPEAQIVQVLQTTFNAQSQGETIDEATINGWWQTCKDYCAAAGCPLPESVAPSQCEASCLYGTMQVALDSGIPCADELDALRQCLADTECSGESCDASGVYEACPFEEPDPDPAEPQLGYAPDLLDLGEAEVGEVLSGTVTIVNEGDGTLEVSSLLVDGDNGFTASTADGTWVGDLGQPSGPEQVWALAGGETLEIQVGFTATQPGLFAGGLSWSTNVAGSEDVMVELAATAIDAPVDPSMLTALEQLQWWLGVYEAGAPVSESELAVHFQSVFDTAALKVRLDEAIANETMGPTPLSEPVVIEETDAQVSAWVTDADGVTRTVTVVLGNGTEALIVGLSWPVAYDQNPNMQGALQPGEHNLVFYSGNKPLPGLEVEILDAVTGAPLEPAETGTTDAYGFVRLSAPPGPLAVATTAADGHKNILFNYASLNPQLVGYVIYTSAQVDEVYAQALETRDPAKGEIMALANYENNLETRQQDTANVLPLGCLEVAPSGEFGTLAFPAAPKGDIDGDLAGTDPNFGSAWVLAAAPGSTTVSMAPFPELSLDIPLVEAGATTQVFAQLGQPTYTDNPTEASCYADPEILSCADEGSVASPALADSAGTWGILNTTGEVVDVYRLDIYGERQLYWQLQPGEVQWRWEPAGGVWVVTAEGDDACQHLLRAPEVGTLAEITSVTPVTTPRLYVELVWDTPGDEDPSDAGVGAGTDLSIHLSSVDEGGLDVDGDGQGDGWFTEGDCYWMDQSPDWGAPGAANDPSNDLDDTDGWGPESIVLEDPAEGVYHVGVEYYDDHGYGPSTATVRIYVDGELAHELTSGELVASDFWVVGTIAFPDATWTEVDEIYSGLDLQPPF